LDVDEELQEDTFIAQIDPDIFESTGNVRLRPSKHTNHRHILSLNPKNEDPTAKTDASSNSPISPSVMHNAKDEFIDLWSPQGHDLPKLQQESKDLRPIWIG